MGKEEGGELSPPPRVQLTDGHPSFTFMGVLLSRPRE